MKYEYMVIVATNEALLEAQLDRAAARGWRLHTLVAPATGPKVIAVMERAAATK